MKTRIISITRKKVEASDIRTIAAVLSRDGVIVYPTDTFYGLGADCCSRPAVKRIFELKKRQALKALPVLVADVAAVRKISAKIPPLFHALATEFWPGPLTMILKAADVLPAELVGPGKTIGIRLPAVRWLRVLIRQAGFPLVATSANISGEGEIASLEKIIDVFNHKVDLIIDGGRLAALLPSTVIDLTSRKPILVRDGAIPRERLCRYLT